MAVGVEADAAAEAGVGRELLFRGGSYVGHQPGMGFVQPGQHVGQGAPPVLFSLQGVEGVDAAIEIGIARRPFARQDARQVVQRLLLPRGHVGQDVLH